MPTRDLTRLQQKYLNEVIPAMKKKFGYKNDLAVPKIEKVIVNTGTGRALLDKKLLSFIMEDLALITGQKPVICKAKKAVSGFKIRKGMTIGAMVRLRGQRMFDFVDRLISMVLPRIRDFRGIAKKSFDGQGNLTIGIKEHTVFPEISHEDVKESFGLEVSVNTTAKTDEQGYQLLKLMGFPLK